MLSITKMLDMRMFDIGPKIDIVIFNLFLSNIISSINMSLYIEF